MTSRESQFRTLKFILILLFLPLLVPDIEVSWAQPNTPWTDGNEGGPLGLARVDVEETSLLTTITGWDSAGIEVGRLELLHGAFELTGAFAEGYDDPGVIGRRLEVNVLGQKLHWETVGFDPTLGLPAHPGDQWAVAAFLEDARVKPVLEAWGIGFLPQRIKNKDPFTCDLTGTHPHECSGEIECPTLLNRLHPKDPTLVVPGTCGRNVAADDAWTVHQTTDERYRYDVLGDEDPVFSGHYNQSFVAQCCQFPDGSSQYLKKSCSDSRICSGDSCQTSCGKPSRPGACVACPGYTHDLTEGKCEIRIQFAGWVDPAAPDEISGHPESVLDNKVYEVCSRVNWTCGDGYCDSDEDCANCAADCACPNNAICETAVPEGQPARCIRHLIPTTIPLGPARGST